MSIRDDFKQYIDGFNLLAPNPQPPNATQGSDNGPMFTSEYYVMLAKKGILTDNDKTQYDLDISRCLNEHGVLCRSPGNTMQEGPDDYYGVMNGCMELGNTQIPRVILKALIKNYGFLNNNKPGTMSAEAFLARQLQLVCSMVTAAFPSMSNPLHYVVRLLALPLYVYSALVLLVSCVGVSTGDTDSRRLAWHLGNCVSKVSLLNKLAYKIWLKRLRKDYPDDMRGVASIYYQPQGNNPYMKHWET